MIPLSSPSLGYTELQELRGCINRNWISRGQCVADAEDELCRLTGRKYAICVSSGTAALHLALLACDIKPGGMVLVPSLTFAAVANTVLHVGAQPLFMDAEPDTWQPSLHWVPPVAESARAMIVAGCYGGIPEMSRFSEFAEKHGIILIEDAAESFGGSWNGKPAGAWGKVSTLSFYANKIVTCGEGGACLTDDEKLAQKIRLLANHGIDNKHYEPTAAGFNYRMTDLQGAVLKVQLRRMGGLLANRRQMSSYYRKRCSRPMRSILHDEAEAPWMFGCLVDDAQKVIENIHGGIELRPFFYPLHLSRLYGIRCECPFAMELRRRGVLLPLYPDMDSVDVDTVLAALGEAL